MSRFGSRDAPDPDVAESTRTLRLVEPPAPPVEGPVPARPVEVTAEVPSLREAYLRYGGFVSSLGLRLLGRREDVEDLCQDVFLEAHRGWGRIRHGEAVRSWLATVTVRLARRRLRMRALRRMVGLDRDYDLTRVADDCATSEERVLLAEVYEILDRTPVEDRLAWVLRHVHGESLPRVAELCGCSLATAKRRIAAAHTRIEGEIRHG